MLCPTYWIALTAPGAVTSGAALSKEVPQLRGKRCALKHITARLQAVRHIHSLPFAGGRLAALADLQPDQKIQSNRWGILCS